MTTGFLKQLGGLALGLILGTTVLAAGNAELAHEKITLWSDGARLQGDIFKPAGQHVRDIVNPMPLAGTYTRDMTFTDDGQVCTSNNPLPAAATEGGALEILCIDANYQPGQGNKVAQH